MAYNRAIASPRIRPIKKILLVLIPFFCAACQLDYYGSLIGGEVASLSNQEPIDQALTDQRLSADEQAKVALAIKVRQFGIDKIALKEGPAFTVFEANGRDPALYSLSGSAKDSLTPVTWDFPFIGRSPFKPYFDKATAIAARDDLVAQGSDAYLAPAASFSTLGIFPDPLRQSNLAADEPDLAELILHEMTHATVFKSSDENFNESLATFVGRRAAQAYFEQTDGVDAPSAMTARTRYSDKAVVDDYVQTLYDHMNNYYTQAHDAGQSSDAIIAARDAEFAALRAQFNSDFVPRFLDPAHWDFIKTRTLDNALILAGIAYQGGLDDYDQVLTKLGGDFPAALAVFAQASQKDDPRQFLHDWSANH